MEQLEITRKKIESLEILACKMRKNILQQVFVANSGHPGGALSMVEILISVFEHSRIHYPGIDLPSVVISKGHAAACLYSWLVEDGRYPREELDGYRMFGSPFQGHIKPSTRETPGIPSFYPSGSLTHGLSLASGVAIAKKQENPEKPNPVFCILSDTEMQGGQIWEAAKQITFHKLSNVIAICDDNGFGNDQETRKTLDIGNLADCWSSCDWNVYLLNDGHDLEALLWILRRVNFNWGDKSEDYRLPPAGIHLIKTKSAKRPTIIIAKTIKGKGISFMENNNYFHGRPPTKEQFIIAYRELGGSEAEINNILEARDSRSLKEVAIFPREKATRDAPSEAILEEMRENEKIIVIAPELAESTRAAKIKKVFPDRVYNFGIGEPNAMDAVAGLAFAGKLPVIMTFTNFVLLRTVDQIFQNIAPFGTNALLVGIQDGFLQDGLSATPYNHYAISRSFFNSIVLAPADYYEAKGLTKEALKMPGYKFLFVQREEMPVLFDENTHFQIGTAKIWSPRLEKWCEKTKCDWQKYLGKDINIVVVGAPFVWFAAEASNELYKKDNIDVGVINMSTIKPLDKETLRGAFRTSPKLLVVEKHSPCGGLYSAICEFAYEEKITGLEINHLPNKEWLGQSGTPDDLIRHYGLDKESIKNNFKQFTTK